MACFWVYRGERVKNDTRVMTREKLERMSKENVEYWLLHEMHQKASDVNADLIRIALDRVAPVTDEDAEAARQSLILFHWEHDAEIKVRRRRRHRVHITMLVVVLLTLMTAVGFALGINIWQVAYEWASEQLFMQMKPNAGTLLPTGNASELEYIADVWGDAVYEMMMEHDIYVRLPAWKPEGYELESIQATQGNSRMLLVTAEYQSRNGERLEVSFRKMEDVNTLSFLEAEFEADENLQEVFAEGEIEYFIMSNIYSTSLAWIEGSTCITISGNLPVTDAKTMIHS